MNKLVIAALLVTQSLAGASPVAAGERGMWGPNPILISEANTDRVDRSIRTHGVTETQQREIGAFGGFRLRIALGGYPSQPKVRGGLTLAPTLHSLDRQGVVELKFGEGLELGYRSGHRLSLSAAGQDIGGHRRAGAQASQEDNEGGLPDWALIAGGVAIALGVGGLIFYDALKDASE